MSKGWKLKEIGANSKLALFLETILCKIFWEKLKNQAKLDKMKNFDICYYVFFSAIAESLLLQGILGTRLCPHKVLEFCYYFLISWHHNSWSRTLTFQKKLSYLLHWKPFKNDKKCFLFHLKSSFSSQDI